MLAQAAEGAHEVHNTLEVASAVGVARSDGVRKVAVEDPRRRGPSISRSGQVWRRWRSTASALSCARAV